MSDRLAALNAPYALFQADDYIGAFYPVGFFFYLATTLLSLFWKSSWRIMDPSADQRHFALRPLDSGQRVRAAPPHPPVSKSRGNTTANAR